MKNVYPAIFTPFDNDEYDVKIPDLPGCRTCGKDLVDAILMAEDAASMWAWDAERNNEAIPSPSKSLSAMAPQFISMIVVDTDEYRRKYDNRAIKKTLTIPAWLNARAESAGVNFSAVLQDGLKRQLNVQDQ